MNIYRELARFSIEELVWASALDWKIIVRGLTYEEESQLKEGDLEKLAFVLEAYYSAALFENLRFRQLFLSRLQPIRLSTLANELTTKAFYDPKIDSRNLSNLPWHAESKIVAVFGEELGVGSEYLPLSIDKKTLIEYIEPVDPLPELFTYQEEVIQKTLGLLKKGGNAFLVQLPTGSGKTRVMMESLIRHWNEASGKGLVKSVLWLAHSSELLEQAIDTFKSVWTWKGYERIRIVRMYGSYNPKEKDFERAFIFCSLQKIGRMGANRRGLLGVIGAQTSVIIIDEAHKITAPTYKIAINVLSKGNKLSLIGTTATPGRAIAKYKANYELASLFGNTLVYPELGKNPIRKLREIGVLSIIEHEQIESDVQFLGVVGEENGAGADFSNTTLKTISRSRLRNELIVRLIERQVRENNPAIVFSCGLEHSKSLCGALAIKGIRASYIDHTRSKGARRRIIESFKEGRNDVIINYGILSTGFDAPRIRSVIITRPTTSIVLYSQMIGRGLRGPKVGGNERCKVIDIKDNFEKYGDVEEVYDCFRDFWEE